MFPTTGEEELNCGVAFYTLDSSKSANLFGARLSDLFEPEDMQGVQEEPRGSIQQRNAIIGLLVAIVVVLVIILLVQSCDDGTESSVTQQTATAPIEEAPAEEEPVEEAPAEEAPAEEAPAEEAPAEEAS